MSYLRSAFVLSLTCIAGIGFVCGCRSRGIIEQPMVSAAPYTREISTPNVEIAPAPEAVEVVEPLTVRTKEAAEDWFLSLEEAVHITLENSEVIRDIGGRVVTGPQGTPTVYDPALQELDPATGVEAALSAFDAQLQSNIAFDRDERAFNNLFFGGGATNVASNTANFDVALTKQSAAGTSYALRNITTYDRNTAPSNLFQSAYNTRMEAEFRQPLLRGAGVTYNRIAGPNSGIGGYNGVVIARIRTDIALADFEVAVRNLVRDVEDAYWQLYFAYRSLDARTAAYEAALASWRTVQDRLDAGGADGEQEALARANFYQTKVAMQNALSGGGTTVGVYSAERNLRQLMGIPANDGRLIRPKDEPSTAERIFDFQEALELALERRVELRRQRWTIKQRQAELLASKNFLLSNLDLIGLYRWRGFGDELIGNRDVLNGSAFSDLYSGALQGWQLGLQFSTTFGKRREFAAVRSAELQLARDRALLRNQELTISNQLSGQFAELDRSFVVTQSNFNRAIAERQRLNAALAKLDAGVEILEFVLEAQRTTADADSEYYRTLVDYNLAVADLHVQRGTYLENLGVCLTEGPSSAAAYNSYRKEFRRFKPRMNYCIMRPGAVSRGAYQQHSNRIGTDDSSLLNLEEIQELDTSVPMADSTINPGSPPVPVTSDSAFTADPIPLPTDF